MNFCLLLRKLHNIYDNIYILKLKEIKMKKLMLIVLIMLTILVSCKDDNPPISTPEITTTPISTPTTIPTDSSTGEISEYFPMNENIHMIYDGTGNEYAPFESYVDYIKDNFIQTRTINGGTIMVNVYQLKENMLLKTFSKGETYYKYNYTDISNQDEIIIKSPVLEGTSWNLSDGAIRSITSTNKSIDTPSGTYKTLEITTKRDDSTVKNYYAKNIGLVKTEFTSDDVSTVVSSELKKINNYSPYTQKVKIYFPEFEKDRIVYIYRDFELKTNEDIKTKFEDEFKNIDQNSTLSKVISPDVKILDITIDNKEEFVTINFSNHLIKDMNAGSGLESMILKSITNTVGEYYQKNKVMILIEGKPYESGVFMLKEGEFFDIDSEEIHEYK